MKPIGNVENKVSTNSLSSTDFDLEVELPERYIPLCSAGYGSSGQVLYSTLVFYNAARMARDVRADRIVAIKKIVDPFAYWAESKRCYRELYLLRRLHHPNFVRLYDAMLVNESLDDEGSDGYEEQNSELLIVTEYISGDLRDLLKRHRQQPIELPLIRKIMWQLLQALTFMHSRDVLHRDLKPENILYDEKAERAVICDLGLARPKDICMTGYVSTRYYRAPEVMLTWQHYGAGVDIWSVGCILGEMALGRILFPGVDHVHHLRLIVSLVGSPSESILSRICAPSTKRYVSMLPHQEPVDFTRLFGPALGEQGADLVKKLLEFDPDLRISASQSLQHSFFNGFPDEFIDGEDASDSLRPDAYDPERWKDLLVQEVNEIHSDASQC